MAYISITQHFKRERDVLAEQKEKVTSKRVVRETFIFEKKERHFVRRFPRVSPYRTENACT